MDLARAYGDGLYVVGQGGRRAYGDGIYVVAPAPGTGPSTPSVLVDQITTSTARLTGSSYTHSSSLDHIASQFRVLSATDEVLFDSGEIGPVEQHTATGLASGTAGLKPQIRYQDEDDAWSEWGEGDAFATQPEPPAVEADNIAGQSARIVIFPVERDHWKVRVRLASTLALIYTSDEIDGSLDLYQLPAVTLQPSTEYVVSGMAELNGLWSEWGEDHEFTTLDNWAPSAPGAWIEPEEASSHAEQVALISEPATDPDGDDDELGYATEMSVEGGLWEVVGGTTLAEATLLPYPAGTGIAFRRRAFDEYEFGPYGPEVSITVTTAPEKPTLLYVELTGPDSVRGHLGAYVGEDAHASSRYQIQEAGGDWDGPDLVDTGYVSGDNLYISPEFSGLTDQAYEMRALQRSNLDVDSEWSDPVEFSPLGEVTTFDEADPFSGYSCLGNIAHNYEVLEVPDSHGGRVVVDRHGGPTLEARRMLWTGGGLTSGLSSRVMNHWNAEHQLAPIVLVGQLGYTLDYFLVTDLETMAGYSARVDFYRQRIIITRRKYDGTPVPGGFIFHCSMPPDRWNTISFAVTRGGYRMGTWLNCGDAPPVLVNESRFYNSISVSVNGQHGGFLDFGWNVPTCISALDIPVVGYAGFRAGFVGEGMRRIDYLATGGGVSHGDLEAFAAPGTSTIRVPPIIRPRAGEVFDATMPLSLGSADTYQVSSDGGETWGSDEVYAGSEVLDVSGWENGYEYMIRAKRGVSAWAYSQKFSIDHRATPICYHRYFGDSPWERPVPDTTPLWNMTENWQTRWQHERLAIPDTALIHGRRNSDASAIVVDEFPSARNAEIRALLRNYHDLSGAGVFGRGSGDGADARGYWASCVKGGYNRLYRRGGGYEAQLGSLPPSRHGAPEMVAMRIMEGRIWVKHWVADSREPEEWMVVRDDPAVDEEGLWGVARRGFYFEGYPGAFESVSLVNLDEEEPPEIIPGPDPVQGAPCTVVLQVYEDDRETVRWEVGDDKMHPNSYLCVPEHYGEQEIDIIHGAATIGQVGVVVIDKAQTIGDQASGWLTERIGRIHGLRNRLLRFISYELGWVTLADGPASAPQLDESYSAAKWTIRDTRDTERKVEVFVDATASWILPMGVDGGWGAYEDEHGASQWLVPPQDPLTGTYHYYDSRVDPFGEVYLDAYWTPSPGTGNTFDEDVLVTDATSEAMQAQYLMIASPDTYPFISYWPNLEILWRLAGSGDEWTVIQPSHLTPDPAVSGSPVRVFSRLFLSYTGELADGTEGIGAFRCLLRGYLSEGEYPTHGQSVEIAVRYKGKPSEKTPFYLEGMTTGELLRDLYDGVYSRPDPITGEVVPSGIRYNEADLLEMTDLVLMRITEPVDDLRAWTEKYIYAPTGWVPALNNDGEISPRSQVPPLSWDGLLEVNNAITEPQPEWSAGERIVNVLTLTYPRCYRVHVSESDAIDRLKERTVTHQYRDESSIDRHATQAANYDARAFAAIGTEDADPVLTVQDELGFAHAENRRTYILYRYSDGARSIEVPVMRDECATLRAGDWVTLDLSWFPNTETGRRVLSGVGGQVLAIHDVDCAWRILWIEITSLLPEGS